MQVLWAMQRCTYRVNADEALIGYALNQCTINTGDIPWAAIDVEMKR